MISYAAIAIALALGAAGSILVRERPFVTRLSTGLVVWLLFSLPLFQLVGSPLNPAISVDPQTALLQRLLVALWWLLAARLAVLGSLLYSGVRRHHQAQLVSDLASAIVYVGAVLVILDKVFDVAVTGLVATSGVIAIVLGLALQNTLGDLFSGIAIGVERPFVVGDRIWIEGAIEGSVIETNWRSTRIVTDSHDVATVPNSVIAKTRLMNRSRPTDVRTDTIHVFLDPAVSPGRGIALLEAAVMTTSGILAEPSASAYCTELRGEGTRYAVEYSAMRRELVLTRSRLLERIAHHAFFAGVAIAMENNLPLAPRAKPSPLEVVGAFDLLADCLPEERETLAGQLVARLGHKGDVLVAQGELRASLFLVASGLFDVLHACEGVSSHLGVLGPGEHIGELSLLAGEPSPVTIKATGAFLAYELTKDSLAPSLQENPRLMHAFEAGALRARARIDRFHAAHEQLNRVAAAGLMKRIRAFFDIQA